MRQSILTTAIAAGALSLALASAPADAQGNSGKHKHKGKHKQDNVVLVDRDGRRDRVIYVDDRDRHPGNNPKAQGRHDNGLHLGWYKQQWHRGDRIPVGYLEQRYYLDDYRSYGLRTPPDGYRWVRPMDDRYLLVQVATGVILDALGY